MVIIMVDNYKIITGCKPTGPDFKTMDEIMRCLTAKFTGQARQKAHMINLYECNKPVR